MSTLYAKLNPARFPHMSSKMAAIVGFILDKEFTNPRILELAITSDGFVIADGAFIGSAVSLEGNLMSLARAASLDASEEKELWSAYRMRRQDHRMGAV